MTCPTTRVVFLTLGFCLSVIGAGAQDAPGPPSPAVSAAAVKDPFEDIYKDYTVDFSAGLSAMQQAGRAPKEMRLSSEKNFFTLTLLEESSRANALVEAARGKEDTGMYRQALAMYQKVIDEYPDALYRVSEWGIFVPIAEYSQLRILRFPKEHLGFYRTKHDARAREAYQTARQRNSLDGLAEVRDKMLATSCGAPALMTLGCSALDRGHFLEALEYFDMAWGNFPELRSQDPHLALSMALCRKRLGIGEKRGGRYGLIGHWKLDEGRGKKAADSSGLGRHGTVADPPNWIRGRLGGALRFDRRPGYRSNSVSVPAATTLNIGVGGSDFSVAFWLNWETGSYPNVVFGKRGKTANDMLNLEVTRKNRIHYKLATQSRVWETGTSRQAIPAKTWVHVGFVKVGGQVKLFLNGKLDLTDTLKAPALQNLGAVTFGRAMNGAMDDVRLYKRALLDREVAALGGAVGKTTMRAAPTGGEAPLAVEFTCPAAGPEAEYLWEFGDGQTASGQTVRHVYGLGGDHAVTLTVTNIQGAVVVARATISVKWRRRDEDFARRMGQVLDGAKYEKQILAAQRTSEPNVSADDYVPMPPTADPLGLEEPVWRQGLADSRRDYYVYTQPVVTRNSVLLRHKNILYCRSLLNGELRWKNDLGGRVLWQNNGEFQWPQEDILVQDGLVFAPMFKVGQTLVAVDEITGRLRWAYGPMVAGTQEEANIRFGAAPAGGPGMVYAGYVLDNITGETHTDSEYGVMAFKSTTGRLLWRRPVCTMTPGKFSAGFAVKRRNRIRSFFSPPLYHEGTVYYTTDAGAIAALDALSGRIKWVMRYPYYRRAHDATRSVHGSWYHPRLWYNQRPLLIGDRLYVLPVDSSLLLSLDRRTGKVLWNRSKMSGGHHYFAGAISTGELALVTYGRCRTGYNVHRATPPLVLLSARTGKTLWEAPDIIRWEDQPVLKHWRYATLASIRLNIRLFDNAARPFLSADDILYVPTWSGEIGPHWRPGCHVYHLTGIDLRNRKIVHQRRYLSETLLAHNHWQITEAATRIKQIEALPFKNDGMKHELRLMKDIAKYTMPVNRHGPFLPFERVTSERYGTAFELRLNARQLEMVYDREKVKQTLAGRTDPNGLFARAELAIAESRLTEAAGLMVKCLDTISSEDLDFRASVNQLLYKVHKELVRAGIRSGDKPAEMAHCLGMNRTVTTLADEVETLFAVAQAAERRGNFAHASRLLQSIANVYGQYEYPVPEIQVLDAGVLGAEASRLLGISRELTGNPMFGPGLQRGVDLLKGTFPVYHSAVSPLPKTLTIRAGELSAREIIRLQKASPRFAGQFDKAARAALGDRPAAEQIARLWEFPGTSAAQAVVEKLIAEADRKLRVRSAGIAERAALRGRMWRLADAARVCGLALPRGMRLKLAAPPPESPNPPLAAPMRTRSSNMAEERGTAWLVLDRKSGRSIRPDLLFLGGRVRKRLDNKFVLCCLDLASGKPVWKARERRGDTWFDELRLRGKGDEPGFFEAFVHGDIVIVHGMFDVLAFGLKDGRLRWRYEVPFAFEIKGAVPSGDLLVLAGQAETLALYLPTRDPRGEVAWQEKEQGDIYIEPYFHGDRLVSLRKAPSNLTVRYRSTGKLIGRLSLPDLQLHDEHPLVEGGPRELPVAHDGRQLVVSDGWYYIMLDVEKMAVAWKRLIDANDLTRLPPMRFALEGDYLAVVKQDYDVKAIYMLSSKSGDVLWHTDPKDRNSPQPISSMALRNARLYGIRPHPGQGFYFVGMDGKTGRYLFPPNEQKGYDGKPGTVLLPALHGDGAVALVKDRQDFEVKAFDLKSGRLLYALKAKSSGNFGEHGRASAAAQNGTLVLLGKDKLVTGLKK